MSLVKCQRNLPVIALRTPTLIERLLFGITCVGFCTDPTNHEQLMHCKQLCGAKLFGLVDCTTPRMLESNEKK